MKRLIFIACALALAGCGGQDAGGGSSAGGGSASGGKVPRIGFYQFTSNKTVDEAREGYLAGLKEGGFEDGKTVQLTVKNAEADVAAGQLICKSFVDDGVDLIATATTASLQAALKATSDIPIVFSAVADPIIAGAGESAEKHRPNVTGIYNPFPIKKEFQILKGCLPQVKKVGTLFDPADPFAEAFRDLSKKSCAELGLEYVDVAANGTTEIVPGVQALHAQGAEAIMQIPGVNLYTGMDSLIKQAKGLGMPVFSVEPNHSALGAVACVGVDFRQGGFEAGQLAARVLKGEKPEGIPFKPTQKERTTVNEEAARGFQITIPADVLKQVKESGGK